MPGPTINTDLRDSSHVIKTYMIKLDLLPMPSGYTGGYADCCTGTHGSRMLPATGLYM